MGGNAHFATFDHGGGHHLCAFWPILLQPDEKHTVCQCHDVCWHFIFHDGGAQCCCLCGCRDITTYVWGLLFMDI